MKPDLNPPPVSAQELFDDWQASFSPPQDIDRGAAWLNAAHEAQLEARNPAEDFVTWEDFLAAAESAKGSPGLDGWTSAEFRFLARSCPWLLRKLFDILRCIVLKSDSIDSNQCPSIFLLFTWKLVGIPKRASDESRPIAVSSILLRCWNKAMLKILPPLPDDQWAGRKETSVAHATADWLAHPGQCGAEIDLQKAFDSVNWGVARAALSFVGTPKCFIDFLELGWKSPRFVNVLGSFCLKPLFPTRSIPQGDPTSPNVLAQILRPWHAMIHLKHPMVKTWAYCDDRSLRCSGTLQDLNDALASTRRFDDGVGFSENMKKRQIWENNDTVEHLGLLVCPTSQGLPTLRDGWEAIAEMFSFLAKIPGGITPRENAVRVFFKSKWTWPVPLIAPPPVSFVNRLFHQILNHTKCSWWCSGRFWADRIDIHPIFGLACAAVLSAHRFHNPPPSPIFSAVKYYLELLDLRLVSWDDRGLYFSVNPHNQNLSRFVSAYGDSIKLEPEGVPPHVLRVAARHKSLLQIQPSRLDSEDFNNIDVEASSHPLWSTWRAKLSRTKRLVLNIYRGGAIHTPTRGGCKHDPSCPFCNAQLGSMRHFWALCPKFNAKRDFLEGFFQIPAGWWELQPRVTSKSGWVVLSAADSTVQRAKCQIAACELAFEINDALRSISST